MSPTKKKVTHADAEAKAKELGAKEVMWVINWCWAKDFRRADGGREFVRWLDANGFEHRGYYPADPKSTNPNLRVDGVRFR